MIHFLMLLLLWQQSPDDGVYSIGPGVMSPKLIHKEEPAYTPVALNSHVQGTVVLQLVIDEQGLPHDITILSPLGFGLDANAIDTVSRWRFRPGKKDGTPVKIRATVEVSFQIAGLGIDVAAEQRRAYFNAIMTRLSLTRDAKPTEDDVKAVRDAANHRLLAANYVLGLWEIQGLGMPKDEAAGLAHIQKAADLHYCPALYYVGLINIKGDRLPKDQAKGMEMIREAATLGSNAAQFKLGSMYAEGSGVEQDESRARKYFQLCAASGTSECQLQLGKLLLDSPQRTESDWLRAIAWLELAQGHDLTGAQAIVQAETAKLTPKQAQSVEKLRTALEHKQQ